MACTRMRLRCFHAAYVLACVWVCVSVSVITLIAVTAMPFAARAGEKPQSSSASHVGDAAVPSFHAKPPKSLRLYVFDCGKLDMDPSGYGFTKDDVATTFMSVPCFLITHPKGTMIWDAGIVPDSSFNSTSGGMVTQGRATATKALNVQLSEIGYAPSDITYLALSHCHSDHSANANEFAHATWLVRPEERDAMFSHPPEFAHCTTPETFSELRNSKTVILTDDEHDVFGDGTVIIKFAPGHSPGHEVLFLKLAKTGPVVLSGDLYHYPEERTQHKIPIRDFNRDQTAASRAMIDDYVKKTGAQLWIEHDYTANAKLKKSPAYYE